MNTIIVIAIIVVVILISIPLIAWFIASLRTIDPKFVALANYFGRWGRRLTSDNGWFGTGIHFVLWFPGIKLILYPKEMQKLTYKKLKGVPGSIMSGNMIEVRSKDNRKGRVEATFFIRFPYEERESLIKIYESEVPLTNDDEELTEWGEEALAPKVLTACGEKKALELAGGKHNKALNKRVNELLEEPEEKPEENSVAALLLRVGLLGANPRDNREGHGEVNFEMKDFHLSKKLGDSIEDEAAAVHIAAALAEETDGRVMKMVAKKTGLTRKELREKLKADPSLRGKPAAQGGYKEFFDYAEDQVKRDRAQTLADVRFSGDASGGALGVPVVFGGGAVPFIDLRQGKKGGGQGQSGGTGKAGNAKNKNKSKKDDDDDEDDERGGAPPRIRFS